MGMHVVAVGSAFDGLKIYGPFKTFEDARSWCVFNGVKKWAIVKLHHPEEN